ncbi:Hypothetical_protein [Hexamita inflata]|uniref:Hypothetical_protein n=1 Tax=Hexamita inflata TaxID=28002 RepID=A0AA86UMM2_9EUKA|nr:Hypothetical protein HINF_LOCUS44941 [Hexamita inflata]
MSQNLQICRPENCHPSLFNLTCVIWISLVIFIPKYFCVAKILLVLNAIQTLVKIQLQFNLQAKQLHIPCFGVKIENNYLIVLLQHYKNRSKIQNAKFLRVCTVLVK